MSFTRTISATCNEMINNILVNFTFNYQKEDSPLTISFNFSINDLYVSGTANINGFTNYNISNGILDKPLLENIESRAIEILKNYETV